MSRKTTAATAIPMPTPEPTERVEPSCDIGNELLVGVVEADETADVVLVLRMVGRNVVYI